jgi:hypothetical protein
MVDFAHLLNDMLHATAPYLIAVAVILWAIAFGTAAVGVWRRGWWARPRPSALFVWSGIGFLAIVLSLCAASVFLTRAALDEVRSRLSAAVTELQVDEKPAADPERLFSALRQIKPHNYHHSHPTTVYRIALQTTEDPWELWLGRDSTVPDEYWVFYPGFDQANDIGTVVSDALD